MGKNILDKKRNKLIYDLQKYIQNNGIPTNVRKQFVAKNGLSSATTYYKYFGGSLIDWLTLCNIKLTQEEEYYVATRGTKTNITKNEAIQIVYKMKNKLNRELLYDDFRHPSEDSIGITTVRKCWGTLNEMKRELGLTIVKESMIDRQLSKEVFVSQIESLANYIKSENRNFLTTREIKNYKNIAEYLTLDKMSKKYFNIPLSQYILNYDIHFGKSGNGLNYKFDDGELAVSYYEYIFSSFLRINNLKYGQDYFRDVKYSDIDNQYNGQMNCDYEIHFNNKILYVEIAGIIENYKEWYYKNKCITYSKSKENYRLKLTKKEKMLKDNNKMYFILFPCDLVSDTYKHILSGDYQKLKHTIEKFNKHNINWKEIKNQNNIEIYKEVS